MLRFIYSSAAMSLILTLGCAADQSVFSEEQCVNAYDAELTAFEQVADATESVGTDNATMARTACAAVLEAADESVPAESGDIFADAVAACDAVAQIEGEWTVSITPEQPCTPDSAAEATCLATCGEGDSCARSCSAVGMIQSTCPVGSATVTGAPAPLQAALELHLPTLATLNAAHMAVVEGVSTAADQSSFFIETLEEKTCNNHAQRLVDAMGRFTEAAEDYVNVAASTVGIAHAGG